MLIVYFLLVVVLFNFYFIIESSLDSKEVTNKIKDLELKYKEGVVKEDEYNKLIKDLNIEKANVDKDLISVSKVCITNYFIAIILFVVNI